MAKNISSKQIFLKKPRQSYTNSLRSLKLNTIYSLVHRRNEGKQTPPLIVFLIIVMLLQDFALEIWDLEHTGKCLQHASMTFCNWVLVLKQDFSNVPAWSVLGAWSRSKTLGLFNKEIPGSPQLTLGSHTGAPVCWRGRALCWGLSRSRCSFSLQRGNYSL